MNQPQNDIFWVVLYNPVDYITTGILLVVLILLYILLGKMKVKPKQEIVQEIVEEVKQKDYKKIIKDFEKKYIESPKDIFYKKLAWILKEILEEAGAKDISKMTLKQINTLKLKSNLKELIKQIYFKEYAKNISDNLDLRKNYIKEIKKLIN